MRSAASRVATIFRRDLLDAIRDARVLIAILVPLALGILYNITFRDVVARPKATVAYVEGASTALPNGLRAMAGSSMDLTLKPAETPQEVRRLVEQKQADIGLVPAPGFDEAVRRGEGPTLTVITSTQLAPGQRLFGVTALLPPVLTQMAATRPPAVIQEEVLEPAAAQSSIPPAFQRIDARRYFVLAALIMLVAMIALLAVPIILSEERQKKTLDALVLVASDREVLAAKALVGLAYTAVSVTLLLALTRIAPADPPTFVAAVGFLSLALIGFGLLMGSVFLPPQLNTWSGFLLMPIGGPAFLVAIPGLPKAIDAGLLVFPTSQAGRLAINGLIGAAVFPRAWLSYLVLAAWSLLGYALVLWRLSASRD